MNTRKENIDQLIGRTIILFFFLLVLAFSSGDSNHQKDPAPVSIEQVISADNSAVLNDPPAIPDYDISLDNNQLLHLRFQHAGNNLFSVEQAATLQIKNEELRFFTIKSGLLRSNIPYTTSFPENDPPLIS